MPDETPYIENPRDMRDLNQNMLLLIQKVNHEQSVMNEDICRTNKEVSGLKTNMDKVLKLVENLKGMKLAIGVIAGVISIIGVFIGILKREGVKRN